MRDGVEFSRFGAPAHSFSTRPQSGLQDGTHPSFLHTALTSLLAYSIVSSTPLHAPGSGCARHLSWRIDHRSRALPATALAVRAQSLHTSAPTPSHIPCWPSHARCPVRLSLSPTTHSVRSHRRPALLHTWPLLSPRLRRSVTRSTFSPPPPPCFACTPP